MSTGTMAANTSSSTIHCNICFVTYVDKRSKLFLLTCNHINCEKCLIVITPDIYRCAVCQAVVKACEINNNMPAHLKEQFHPEPYLDGLKKIRQAEHPRDYVQHLKKEHDELEEKQKQVHSLKQDCNQEMFNQQLNNERKCVEHKTPVIRQQKNTTVGVKRKSASCFSPGPPFTSSTGPRMPAPTSEGQNSGEIATFKNFKTNTNLFFL